jgi:hypothetical protein
MSQPSHDIRISVKRKSPWRHLRRLIWLGLLAVVAAPFAMLAAMSGDRPLVQATAALSGSDAARATRLVASLKRDIGAARKRSSVTITERDANTAMALARRALGAFSGRVKMESSMLTASATVHVPQNPFGKFINLRLSVQPSEHGLALGELQAGLLSIPGQWMTEAVRWGLNLAAENYLGDQLFGAIYAVRTQPGSVTVEYGPVRNLLAQTAVLKRRGAALRDELQLLGDVEVTRSVFAHVCAKALAAPEAQLGDYLAWAFTHAASRTGAGNDGVAENRAALLALSILLGSRRLESLTGDVRGAHADCDGVGHRVTVAGRNDLRQHFVISAALEVFSDAGASFAIGEFKELTDSGRGGSGFSFVDLAADRAGLKFAELALSTTGARTVQRHAAALGNAPFFFPSTTGLREGLSAAQFERRYGSVDSDAYVAMLKDIDARIARAPLFKAAR